MEHLVDGLRIAGSVLGYALAVCLCLAGLVLSSVSISGTWLVVAATALAGVMRQGAFPGVWTVVAFALVSGLVEGIEFLAASWGVTRKGGSRRAGVAALVGGLLGMVVGTLIPVPVFGSLIGMVIGGFVLVYLVEKQRLKATRQAADIAWGVVVSRILVTVLKVVVTLGMTAVLFVGMATS